MTVRCEDETYALENEQERARRRRMLGVSRVAPLTRLVHSLRTPGKQVPDFDPCDGGVKAQVLFLLEAPGRQARKTGFISRNNPDPTAKAMCGLLAEAGLRRVDTVLWNVVPWYLGSGRKVAGAKRRDIVEAQEPLRRLCLKLQYLKAVVLVGRAAQRARPVFAGKPELKVFETFHPSPRVRNRWPQKWKKIATAFREVAAYLDGPG